MQLVLVHVNVIAAAKAHVVVAMVDVVRCDESRPTVDVVDLSAKGVRGRLRPTDRVVSHVVLEELEGVQRHRRTSITMRMMTRMRTTVPTPMYMRVS